MKLIVAATVTIGKLAELICARAQDELGDVGFCLMVFERPIPKSNDEQPIRLGGFRTGYASNTDIGDVRRLLAGFLESSVHAADMLRPGGRHDA